MNKFTNLDNSRRISSLIRRRPIIFLSTDKSLSVASASKSKQGNIKIYSAKEYTKLKNRTREKYYGSSNYYREVRESGLALLCRLLQ